MFPDRFRRAARLACLAVAAGALGACSAVDRLANIGKAPALSSIEDPTAQPGYKPVRLPMPDPQTVAFASNSLWRQGSRAFFKDQRAARVGDLVTVRVKFTDQAQINNQTTRTRTNAENMGMGGMFGFENELTKVLPDGTKADALLKADSSTKSEGAGTIRRSEQLVTNVAAIVTQVLPNGNLVVEGQAGDQGQLRSPRADRRRSGAAGGYRGRQHHRFDEDRPGPHRLWRPRPDHRRPAAALRPAGHGRAAALLAFVDVYLSI